MILTTTQESLVILFYDRSDPQKVICDLIAVFFLQMIEYVQFFWPFSSGCLPRFRDFQSEKHLKNDKIIQKPSKVTPLYKEGLYSLYSLHVGLWQHLCFSHLGWWCQEGVPWHPHLIVSPLH